MVPQAIAIFTTIHDTRFNRKLTATGVREAYQLIREDRSMPLERVKKSGGPLFNAAGELIGDFGGFASCYFTTKRCVEEEGGRAVFGWLVHRINTPTGKNDMAHLEAVGHAIWERPDGRRCEVTDVDRLNDTRFVPHPRVKFGCQASMYFIDHIGYGSRIVVADDADMTEVRLAAVFPEYTPTQIGRCTHEMLAVAE